MIVLWALDFAMSAVSLSIVLCGLRLLRGPDIIDRVLALDTLYVNVVALVVLLGMRLESSLFFAAALLIALLGFAGSVGLSRYLSRGGGGSSEGRSLRYLYRCGRGLHHRSAHCAGSS